MTVDTGGKVVLKVTAFGAPAPEYEWFRDGELYGYCRSSECELDDTVQVRSTSYFCKITNAVGFVKSDTVIVKVVQKGTVVSLKVKVNNPETKKGCHQFFKDTFAKFLSKVLSKNVVVTKVNKVDNKAELCNITACSKNPCKNDKTCSLTENGFKCDCKTSWRGDTCGIDRNECGSNTTTFCYGNGKCKNLIGSFSCDCPNHLTGHRCEYKNNACTPNPCDKSTETCVPSEIMNHTCVKTSGDMTVVVHPDLLKPWTDQKKYDLQDLLNEIIKTSMGSKPSFRRRRNIATPSDFDDCTIHITGVYNATTVKIALDCRDENDTVIALKPKSRKGLCDRLFDSSSSFQQCGQPGLMHKKVTPKLDPVTVDLHIVVENTKGPALSAKEATDLLKSKDIENVIKNYKDADIQVTDISAVEPKPVPVSKGGDNKVAIIVGVCVALIVFALLIAILIYVRHRRKANSKESLIMMQRSVMSHDISSSDLLPSKRTNDPGNKNLAFNNDDGAALDAGSFMFRMPSDLKASNKTSKDPVNNLPWYHGDMNESMAEKLVSQCNDPGTFMLYKNPAQNLVIAVSAPDGGPAVRHLPIKNSNDGTFEVRFGSGDSKTFNTIQRIVDYYHAHSISFDETTPEVLFTQPLPKSAV